MDIVRSESLVYKYTVYNEDTVSALSGIDLSIEQGRFTAILGRNGSGKSTLAKHINALLTPTEGTVWVNGYNTKDETHLWDVRQSAGMVFQNPDNQIIATIVEEDVAFGPENLGVPPDQIRVRVDEAMDAAGIGEFRRSAPHNLSGGQKQRVAIAGVLAMKPSCIVLDEPTAMLDPSGRREVIDTVMKLNKEEGISVILITHFMEEAVRADRVIVVDQGKIVMDGAPREVFRRVDMLKSLGLDVPQATELAHALNAAAESAALPDDLLTMNELADALNTACCPDDNTTTRPPGDGHPYDCTLCRGLLQKPAYVIPGLTRDPLISLKYGIAGQARNDEKVLCNSPEDDKYCQPPADNKPILEAQNISYIYSRGSAFEKKALDNISLSIKPGEFIGLIGHTGSGKSTLIQHFNALLSPTSGRVLFNGEDIRADKSKLKSIRQRVGLVFQYPEHQLFEMTVLKDVSFGPENLGLNAGEVRERAVKALTAVGLEPELFEKSPFELSGGQKRRAAIAGVLAMQPETLILDEPTAGLDPKGRDDILAQIKFMHGALKLTVILVSHNMEDVAKLAQRVIVINRGRIAYDGEPGDVFSHIGELESMGLAAPQTTYLMRSLRQDGWNVPEKVFTLADAAYILAPYLKQRPRGVNMEEKCSQI